MAEAYLVCAREGIVCLDGNGEDVLVGVDERVRNRDDGRVRESERDACNRLDTGHEPADQFVLANVQYMRREGRPVVVDHRDSHAVCEGRNVQHVQEGGLGWTDSGPGMDDLDVLSDFDGTTGDLGRDRERLEEGCLSRFHTRVSGRDRDVYGSNGTSTSGGLYLVGDDDFANFLEVTGGKDEANVTLYMREETFELGVLGENVSQRSADHGVLAHEDDTLAAKGDTNLMHLIGTDIVYIDDEDAGYGGANK